MTRLGKPTSSMPMATILALATLLGGAEARVWWSLEIPALDSIHDADPLFGTGASLLMEDTGFLHGSFNLASDHVKVVPDFDPFLEDAMDPLTTYSTPAPSVIEGGEEVTASPVTSSPSAGSSMVGSTASSSDAPTAPPVQMVGPFPTETPSPQTSRPTPSPTQRYQAANGGCPPNHSLHRLWLYDSQNDGWGSTKLVVKENNAGMDDAAFIGTLNALNSVVRYETGANMADSHSKTLRQEVVGGRRRMDMTRGGSISGPSGTITWDANGKVTVRGPHEGDNAHAGEGGVGINPHDNTPDAGVVDGPSGSISWGDGEGKDSNEDGSDGGNGHGNGNGNGKSNTSDGSDVGIASLPANEWTYLCLRQDACYTARVSGGTFLEETRWEITRVEVGPDSDGDNIGLVATGVGGGTGMCEFSLDGSCAKTCDGTEQTPRPTANPTEPVPSQMPSDSPTGKPTDKPALSRNRKPSTPAPSLILPQDKEFIFGIEEYNRIRDIVLPASRSRSSTEALLTDDESPQSLALDWLYSSGASGLSDRRMVQRWALASFYYGAGGEEWIDNTGWLQNGDECQWYGVSCLDGIVSKLELERNHLVGEIVPEITVFADSLYVLSLGNDYDAPEDEKNRFVAPLPHFLGDLGFLSYLNLEDVGLTSAIPENLFSNWIHMENLFLNNNDLTGTLPTSIKDLSSIEVMWLGGNNLGGPIISEIGQLSPLKDLSLESNFRENEEGQRGFITTVPPEIGQLTNLEVLSLADNALSGQVPMQLKNLLSLRKLQLSGNFFEGQLPPALGSLEMLEELDISFNWLSSTIPAEYGNMISLSKLTLQSNYNDKDGYLTFGIKDKLPTELGNLSNLQHMDLSDNYLTGTLITEIGKLFHLQTLHLQNNMLQGPIPDEYSNCVALEEIRLQDNDVDDSFSMPQGVCSLPELDLAAVDCGVSCACCLQVC